MGTYYALNGVIPVKEGLDVDAVNAKIRELLGEDYNLFESCDCRKNENSQTLEIVVSVENQMSYSTSEDIDGHMAKLAKEFLPPGGAASFTQSGNDFDDGPVGAYVGRYCDVQRKKLEALDAKIKEMQAERAKITHELNLDAKNEFISTLS